MNGEKTSHEAKNKTPKPHCVDPHRVTAMSKEGWQRLLTEKLVRLGKEWRDDRRKYSRLEYFINS
jgi:hypothetical protein